MRVYAISDVHTDFRKNRLLVESLPDGEYRDDTLILAGDIADALERIKATLGVLRSKFSRVFYTPGNHELWVRDARYDSLEKLAKILDLCAELGVETAPARAAGYWIVPLFSWYGAEFARGERIDESELAAWADFQFCKWPEGVGELCSLFSEMNRSRIREYDGAVISFSHFLPRRELLPPVEYLRFKALPRVAGCLSLDEQIRKINSAIHVFGHSHINWDTEIDGVRYVQNALSYPREREHAALPIKQIA